MGSCISRSKKDLDVLSQDLKEMLPMLRNTIGQIGDIKKLVDDIRSGNGAAALAQASQLVEGGIASPGAAPAYTGPGATAQAVPTAQ